MSLRMRRCEASCETGGDAALSCTHLLFSSSSRIKAFATADLTQDLPLDQKPTGHIRRRVAKEEVDGGAIPWNPFPEAGGTFRPGSLLVKKNMPNIAAVLKTEIA